MFEAADALTTYFHDPDKESATINLESAFPGLSKGVTSLASLLTFFQQLYSSCNENVPPIPDRLTVEGQQ